MVYRPMHYFPLHL